MGVHQIINEYGNVNALADVGIPIREAGSQYPGPALLTDSGAYKCLLICIMFYMCSACIYIYILHIYTHMPTFVYFPVPFPTIFLCLYIPGPLIK